MKYLILFIFSYKNKPKNLVILFTLQKKKPTAADFRILLGGW